MTVVLSGLTKTFGAVQALDDVSFEVRPGRVTGFLGPNGAGKTTALRILLGLARPDAGRAEIDGQAYAHLPNPRRAVGAVLDSSGFHPGRRGRDHLRILARSAGVPYPRVDAVLAQVGLGTAGRRRAGGYSLGMRQRLALASALLGDPGVVVLDEPGNGLDPAGSAWLRESLHQLAADGRTVLVSSHGLNDMAQIADDVVILSAGRLRYSGALTNLVPDQEDSLESAFLRLTDEGPVAA